MRTFLLFLFFFDFAGTSGGISLDSFRKAAHFGPIGVVARPLEVLFHDIWVFQIFQILAHVRTRFEKLEYIYFIANHHHGRKIRTKYKKYEKIHTHGQEWNYKTSPFGMHSIKKKMKENSITCRRWRSSFVWGGALLDVPAMSPSSTSPSSTKDKQDRNSNYYTSG